MGELNTAPFKINKVEGAAGQVKISGGPGVPESFGAPIPASHGIAQHTDVTRYKFIPCGVVYTGGPTTFAGGHSGIALDSTVDEYVHIEFECPNDFVSFTSLQLIYYTGDGGIGNAWVCDPSANYCAPTAAGVAGGQHSDDPVAITITPPDTSKVFLRDIGFTLASLAKNDIVGVRIYRDADNIADNWTADITVFGLLLTYVAEQ